MDWISWDKINARVSFRILSLLTILVLYMRRPDDVAKAQWQDNWVFEWVVLNLLPLALHVPAAACHSSLAAR